MKTGKTYVKFRELLRSPYADLTSDECYDLTGRLEEIACRIRKSEIRRPQPNPNHKPCITVSRYGTEVALNERNH